MSILSKALLQPELRIYHPIRQGQAHKRTSLWICGNLFLLIYRKCAGGITRNKLVSASLGSDADAYVHTGWYGGALLRLCRFTRRSIAFF